MKNTRKVNLKTRLIAATIALASMVSTTTVIFESSINPTSIVASAEEPVMDTENTETPETPDETTSKFDDYVLKAEKITVEILFKVLEECVPGGKFVSPALQGVIGMAMGEEPDPVMDKLNELSDKIDGLFDKINESEKTVIGAMETALGSNNAYQSYVNFKNKINNIEGIIKETVTDNDMSNVDKLAKIGSLIGNFYEWDNKIFDIFNDVNTYYRKSSAYGKNIFETIYDHNCLSSMFSGEAIDKSTEAFNIINQTYTAGCTVILEVLGAQLYVNYLSDNAKTSIDKEYMSHICQKPKDIMSKINKVTTALIGDQTEDGFEGKGEIAKMMEETLSRPRNILVDEGHGTPYTNLSTTLFSYDLRALPSVNNKKNDCKRRGKAQADWFNNNVTKGQINKEKVKSIAKYAAKNGKTVRQLLEENDFDTSNLPKNCFIITDGANNEGTLYVAYDKGYAYFKGVNIDSVKYSETEKKIWEGGWKWGWNYGPAKEEWENFFDGSACRFQTV